MTQITRDDTLHGVEYVTLAEAKEYAAACVREEREQCAQVCENDWSNVAERIYGQECAAAIRARGNA